MRLPPDIWELNPENLDFKQARRDADAQGWLRPWMVLAFNVLVALALDVWGFFGHPMPGAPARLVLSHLREDGTPPVSNVLWGYFVRLGDRLPFVDISAWMAGVSAFFGVLCVFVLTWLLLHKGYWVVEKSSPPAVLRESWSRRLAALGGGLYLAVSTPFWVASTRAYPMTFHLFLLLVVACFFEAYRKTGLLRWMGLCLFLWGVLATQTDTAWFFAPVVFWLVVREMIHWNHHLSWKAWLMLVFAPAAGLSYYAVLAWQLWRRGEWLQLYSGGISEALLDILKAQFAPVYAMHFSPAILVFAAELAVPWCTLFLLSHRCPWCYESGEILIRILFGVILVVLAWTPPFSPCFLAPGGLWDPPLVPYLILALCVGCLVGESWIMGDIRPRIDNSSGKRLLRRFFSFFTFALLAGIAASLARNAPMVRIPDRLWTFDALDDIFRHRGERDVIICGTPFDDLLILQAREKKLDIGIVSTSRVSSRAYLRLMANRFAFAPAVAECFSRGSFEEGIRLWLDNPELVARSMTIGRPDLYNEYGWLAPVGIATRIETDPALAAIPPVIATQLPIWERVADQAGIDFHPYNPYGAFWKSCLAIIARQINDVAVLSAENGDFATADRILLLAERIAPANLSVKMNLERVAQAAGFPEEEVARRREERERQSYVNMGLRWMLGAYFGYVWQPRDWMREGVVWALSGTPLAEAGARRKPALDVAADGRYEKWLDRAFMVIGQDEVSETAYRQILMGNPWLTFPLVQLSRLALRAKQPEIAEAYLVEAQNRGEDPDKLSFEWLMVDYTRLLFSDWPGQNAETAVFPVGVPIDDIVLSSPLHNPAAWLAPDNTVRDPSAVLRELSEVAVGEMRIWMTLYLLADGRQPESDIIEKILKTQRANDPDLWLTMCSVHIHRKEWDKARDELDQVLKLDVERVAVWEMTMDIAQHNHDLHLLVSAKNRLLRMRPFHYLAQQQLGAELYQRGDLEGAARVYERGVFFKRDPVLLNNLAYVLSEIDPVGNHDTAYSLVSEAIKRDPDRREFFNTRAAISLHGGDTDTALADLRALMAVQTPTLADWLLLAEICKARNDPDHARRALRQLEALPERPRFQDRTRIFAVKDWLAEQPAPPAAKPSAKPASRKPKPESRNP